MESRAGLCLAKMALHLELLTMYPGAWHVRGGIGLENEAVARGAPVVRNVRRGPDALRELEHESAGSRSPESARSPPSRIGSAGSALARRAMSAAAVAG